MNRQLRLLGSVRDRLPRIVLLLCVVQPVLDVAGYWQQTLNVGNAATMLLRMLLLGGTVLLGFLLSERKRCYLLTGAVLGALTLGHILACCRSANGYVAPVTDLINLVRIYFLPLTTLCFISFLRANEEVFPAMVKGMTINLFVIAGVQLVSALTGTDPHTYSVDGIGVRGWFLWTNSQSAILAMIAPISICWALKRWEKKLLPLALTAAVAEATLYVLAPRLAYASLAAVGFGTALCLLLIDRARWRQALVVTLVTGLFVAAMPLSPMYQRLSVNYVRTEQTEEQIKEMDIQFEVVTEPETEETPTDQEGATGEAAEKPKKKKKKKVVIDADNADKLEKLYLSQDIIWSMIDRFGREKVFEIYDYTLDPTILGNTRLMKIRFCELLMDESGLPSQLFGLNLAEMTHKRQDAQGLEVVDNYDVENDMHGVYFLTGWVGLGLMLAYLLWFGLRALLAVIRRPKVCFNLSMCAFAMAYGLGVLHAYFTASVLRRNNASFYLALVLAGLWYLSRRQTEKER